MEQSQQGISCSCIPFIIPCLWLCGVFYALCLLLHLLQCCLEMILQLSLSPGSLLNGALLVQGFGLLQPLLFRVFLTAPWDSLSGLCALWESLSSFPSLWLGRCTLGWPVWPVIGFPLLGVHPSISTVKLIMIGYCCNGLDGQLNCQASVHWLVSVTIMYRLCNQ